MNVFVYDLKIKMNQGLDIKNITDMVGNFVKKSGIKNGVIHVTSMGSTGSVTTIEYESGAIEDLKRCINKLAPPGNYYEHEKTWHDGNGHSHVQAALIGPSISIPIREYKLTLGTWQQIVLINHDIRPRERKISLTVIGV